MVLFKTKFQIQKQLPFTVTVLDGHLPFKATLLSKQFHGFDVYFASFVRPTAFYGQFSLIILVAVQSRFYFSLFG